MRTCPKCNKNSEKVEFFKPSKTTGKKQSYCKPCNNRNTLYRQQQFKIKCLEYLGGASCQKCDYDKCIGALEFHHIDPSQKDFQLSKYKNTSWEKTQDIVKQELDKCIVLCANCHREAHHNGIINW